MISVAAKKPTPHQRIIKAAAMGMGVRLSPDETFALSLDHAIATRAALDDEASAPPKETL